MRFTLLLGVLALLVIGAHEPGSLAQSPAAHRETGYQLSVRFGLGQDAPVLLGGLDLGVPFGAQLAVPRGMGNELIVGGVSGQIEVPRRGKFPGIITYVDYSAAKEGYGIGVTSTNHVELELGKSYTLGIGGGLLHCYSVTLTKKPSQ